MRVNMNLIISNNKLDVNAMVYLLLSWLGGNRSAVVWTLKRSNKKQMWSYISLSNNVYIWCEFIVPLFRLKFIIKTQKGNFPKKYNKSCAFTKRLRQIMQTPGMLHLLSDLIVLFNYLLAIGMISTTPLLILIHFYSLLPQLHSNRINLVKFPISASPSSLIAVKLSIYLPCSSSGKWRNFPCSNHHPCIFLRNSSRTFPLTPSKLFKSQNQPRICATNKSFVRPEFGDPCCN